jgi:tRNA threonylcarbamoyladenosine biosynthesis protein TsaB
MLILGVDTSTPRLSLALRDGTRIVAERTLVPSRRAAESILPELQTLLASARLTPADLKGLAVGLGPGSFTGLRVGIATVQGLGQSLGVPVAGVSSFLAVAAATRARTALGLEDARREQVYAALYMQEGESWRAVIPENLFLMPVLAARLAAQSVSGPLAVTGPAAERFFAALAAMAGRGLTLVTAPDCLPNAAVIAALAEPALLTGGTKPEDLVPLYVRRTQAEEQKQK